MATAKIPPGPYGLRWDRDEEHWKTMRTRGYAPGGGFSRPWFQQLSKVGALRSPEGGWQAVWHLDGERYPHSWLDAFPTKLEAETYALGRVGHVYATEWGDADHDLRVVRFTPDELKRLGPAPKAYS